MYTQCMNTLIYIHAYMCMHTYIIHIHTYKHTHKHTHTKGGLLSICISYNYGWWLSGRVIYPIQLFHLGLILV